MPVNGEDLIVEVLAEKFVARDGQLRANEQPQDARQDEEEEGSSDIKKTDHRIVDRSEQPEALRRRPDAFQFRQLALRTIAFIGKGKRILIGHDDCLNV